MILANGQIAANAHRPDFPWRTIQHTNSRDNRKLWKTNRPVPLNYEIPMDWHHIIPWNVLRNGWSALATSAKWDVLEAWANLWRDMSDDLPAIMTAMKNNTLGAPHNADMYDRLCWAKWNLVEGPTNGNRAPGDDPGGNGLDAFEGAGISGNLRSRSLTLKSIYTTIRQWPADKDDVTDHEAKNLKKLFESLKPYANTDIPTFNPTIWELVTPGKIDKFGFAKTPQAHPTWKKRR